MESVNIKELNDRIQKESGFVDILSLEMGKVIVGQKHLVENLMIALLADGHILLEGMPGLAKTLAISTLSKAVGGKFSRIQFTPDLLPADVTGTLIYSQKKEEFEVHTGPIFANFVLADEINRAPAKVQSALLEARHAELQQAYDHAKEEERVRNAVLHKMTRDMSAPVADITAVSRTICEEYENMTDDYMDAMVDKIENDANQVAELLNELLRAAQEETNTHHP